MGLMTPEKERGCQRGFGGLLAVLLPQAIPQQRPAFSASPTSGLDQADRLSGLPFPLFLNERWDAESLDVSPERG